MILYLLRHPPTGANRRGLVLGTTDPPADPEGLAAFATLVGPLAKAGIARVFASPLVRAAEAARLLAKRLGAPLILAPGLAELSAGDWEGRPRRDVLPGGGLLRASWTARPPGGESLADAEARVAAALEQVRLALAEGPAALVGHAVVNRLVLKLYSGQPEAAALAFVQSHQAVLALAPDGSVTRLAPGRLDGRPVFGPPGRGAA